jgi:hypothetical protein
MFDAIKEFFNGLEKIFFIIINLIGLILIAINPLLNMILYLIENIIGLLFLFINSIINLINLFGVLIIYLTKKLEFIPLIITFIINYINKIIEYIILIYAFIMSFLGWFFGFAENGNEDEFF